MTLLSRRILPVFLLLASSALAQGPPPPPPGATVSRAATQDQADTQAKKKMPWEVKDELTYFEPALTPWPPLPPGMSFEDLMDEFLACKNLSEEGREGPVPTPDWDRQHLIIQELFKMKRANVIPKLLEVIARRDPAWLKIAIELSAYYEDASVIPEVAKVAGDLKQPPAVRIASVVTLARVSEHGSAAIVPTLTGLYAKEPDPSVRIVILEQLDMVGNDSAVPFLCDKWRTDPDLNVKVSAVFGLVNYDTPAALDCILAATKSKEALVREAAAKVLSRTAGAAAAAAMKDRPRLYTPERLARMKKARDVAGPLLLDADPKVRMAAARALYDLGDETSLPFIEKAMASGTVELKELLVEILARIRTRVEEPQPPGEWLPVPTDKVVPILVKALESEEERVAYQAARSLGYTKSEQAVEALEKALSHSSQVVRTNAAGALGNIRSERSMLALVAAAPKADPRVQYAIAQALSQLAAAPPPVPIFNPVDMPREFPPPPPPAPSQFPGAVAALMRMSKQGDTNFRANALSLLGEARDPAAIPVLRAALKESDPGIRAAAIRGLGNLRDRTAVPDLVRLMDDPSPQLRAAAVNAIVEFKDPTLTDTVAKGLYDPEETVRSVTIDALERQGDPRAIRHLKRRFQSVRDDLDFALLVGMGNIQGAARDRGIELSGTEDDAVPLMIEQATVNNWQKRLASMFALGRSKDARAVPYLRGLLNDPVVDVRVSSLDTLGTLGANDPETIKAIKELRKRGDDRWVRDIAITNLVKLGDEETIREVVAQAKNDEDPERRHYAIMYLQESDNRQVVPYLMEMLDDEAEIGLAITTLGLVPGGVPYYEASSGLYPKVQEAAVGAVRKILGFGHPAIDLAPNPDSPGYGIFETRKERIEGVRRLRQWWIENKEKVLSAPADATPWKLPPLSGSAPGAPAPTPQPR